MLVRFVCLANSYKEGGRCVAGIMLDDFNNPVIKNDLPTWIRPVSSTGHGEIHKDLVSHIHLLDIIEIEISEYVGAGFQVENAIFLEKSVQIIGAFDIPRLNSLCEKRSLLFGSTAKAINIKYINRLDHSLTLVRTTDFKVLDNPSDDNPARKKIRLSFTYNNNEYNLPVTDPVFLHDYQNDANFMDGIEEVYLTLSVGVVFEEWHHKLVAGIIIPNGT
jgi:hypothetical protein